MTAPSESRPAEQANTPEPIGFGPISLPTRDVAQSRRFFTEVLGGEVVAGGPHVRIRLGTFEVALGPQEDGATSPHREHPHYAFTVHAEDFAPLKERLEAFGVPTHEPWTRTGSLCSLMYFRDPSGNQFEMFCPEGDVGLPLRIGARAGGNYVIPFPSLVYREVTDPTTAPPAVRASDFNHMTIPSRDLGESKRFLTEVFGGKVTIDHPSHVTVVVGGAEIGNGGPMDGGWPAPDAEYPHYTLLVAPEDLAQLRDRLNSYGVPAGEIFTTDNRDAAVFYRDPTGNLWKLYCEAGFSGPTRRAPSAGGDYVTDLPALCYDRWDDPAAEGDGMLRSIERIVTSHAGALEQPEALRPAIRARDERQPYDEEGFNAQLRDAVSGVVRAQLACGLDSVCDGEFGKQNFTSYVGARLDGYEPRTVDSRTANPGSTLHRDFRQYPGYYARRGDTLYGRGTSLGRTRLTCTGPLRYADQSAIQTEIHNLQHALEGQTYGEAFLPAAGPGILSSSTTNEYYPNDEAFLWGLADAMRVEYQAIVDAGFLLQVDDPHLLIAWQHFPEMSIGGYWKHLEMLVAAVNRGLEGIPPERVRLHTCWGSWVGPHTGDVPLRDVVEILLRVNANEISIEASNPWHDADWRVWEQVKLPPEKVLMPGVVGHYTDFVEAPELIADRLVRYARLVGRENVVAGTDCGLRRVGHPEIAWAKFRAMAEGARLATKQLWG